MASIDILFVLDCTASMMPWIHAARQQVRTTLDSLQMEHPNSTFRAGLIVFRDFGDDINTRTLGLTLRYDRIETILGQEFAEGGDDDAENLTGALWIAAREDWSADIRHVFVITDAPAHGLRYHAPYVTDRFPDGDPEGRVLEDEVQSLARKRVNMTFIRIHPRTDMLIGVLRRVYGVTRPTRADFTVEDLTRPEDLPPPPGGLERHGVPPGGDEDTISSPDAVLSRALTRAVTQSLSVYDRTD